MFEDQKDVEAILKALGEQLEGLLDKPIELLVCGGSALNVLGLVRRATKDVDVLAYIGRSERGETFLIKADFLTPELATAAKKVARDFDLPDDWLNTGPASAVDLGLPNGFMGRVATRVFGNKLAIHFLGHDDQIHFKLYAAVDQGPGKHLDDLSALKPTTEEIENAARWTMTHDVSDGYKQTLKNLLEYMGFKNVAERL
jgi:hypothetical protein